MTESILARKLFTRIGGLGGSLTFSRSEQRRAEAVGGTLCGKTNPREAK